MTGKTAPTTKRKPRTARTPVLTWTTEIAHTRHHWWWYLVIIWAGWSLSWLLLAYGNWSAALVTAVAAVGLVVINVGKPRVWTVTIKGGEVVIERPDDTRFRYVRPLERYRGFTVVEMPVGRRDAPQRAIALLPHRRLQPAQLLVVPHDTYKDDSIVQQFSDYLPYEGAAAFTAADRALTRIAGWVGIR